MSQKDHYVPQFLLRNFSIEKNVGQSGLVYIYKKPFIVRPREGSIAKHAANEPDFYEGRDAITKQPTKITDDIYREIEKGKNAPSVI